MGRAEPTSSKTSAGKAHNVSPGDAALILAKRDPVIRRLVKEVGLPVFPKPQGTHFASLVQSITYQQLAGGAARAIHQRLVRVLHNEVTPERILAASPSDLRQAGLSNSKVASIIDLATKVSEHSLSLDGRRIARESDTDMGRRSMVRDSAESEARNLATVAAVRIVRAVLPAGTRRKRSRWQA